jgi:hypothetical protein
MWTAEKQDSAPLLCLAAIHTAHIAEMPGRVTRALWKVVDICVLFNCSHRDLLRLWKRKRMMRSAKTIDESYPCAMSMNKKAHDPRRLGLQSYRVQRHRRVFCGSARNNGAQGQQPACWKQVAQAIRLAYLPAERGERSMQDTTDLCVSDNTTLRRRAGVSHSSMIPDVNRGLS